MKTEERHSKLEAMLDSIARELGFSETEWQFLQAATNGTMLYCESTVRLLDTEVEDADADSSRFAEFGVDREAFLAKLRGLDPLARLAVVHQIDRRWDSMEQ